MNSFAVKPVAEVNSFYCSNVVLNEALLPDVRELSGNDFSFSKIVCQLIVDDKRLHFCIIL